VVVVAFQITFRAEMHANDVFLFFLKLFLTSAHQNNPKHIKLYQKTIKNFFEFFKNAVCTAFPNDVSKKKTFYKP